MDQLGGNLCVSSAEIRLYTIIPVRPKRDWQPFGNGDGFVMLREEKSGSRYCKQPKNVLPNSGSLSCCPRPTRPTSLCFFNLDCLLIITYFSASKCLSNKNRPFFFFLI